MTNANRDRENPYAAPNASPEELSESLVPLRIKTIVRQMAVWSIVTLVIALAGIGYAYANINKPALMVPGFFASELAGLILVGSYVPKEVKWFPRWVYQLYFVLSGLGVTVGCLLGAIKIGNWIWASFDPVPSLVTFLQSVIFLLVHSSLLSIIFRIFFHKRSLRFCLYSTAGFSVVLVAPIIFHLIESSISSYQAYVTSYFLTALVFLGFGIAGMLVGVVPHDATHSRSVLTPKQN